MPKINRQEFLQTIEKASVAVNRSGAIEQTNCFAIDQGNVTTFAEEVSCSCPLPSLDGLKGAVAADPLLQLLRKLKSEEITVETSESELIVTDKARKSGITLEQEIRMSLDSLEKPEKWLSIPEGLIDALPLIGQCTSDDGSYLPFTCVRFTADYMESCDNSQACRRNLKTGFKESIWVRWKDSLQHVVKWNPIKMAETKNWLHFRDEEKAILSCRKYVVDDFFPLDKLVKKDKEAVETGFPKGLKAALDRASIFSKDSITKEDRISIHLSSGKIRIRGQGIQGWYDETQKLEWSGPEISFLISPAVLGRLAETYESCEISAGRLRIAGDGFVYTAMLYQPDAEKAENGK